MKETTSDDLSTALEEHLRETEEQVSRVETLEEEKAADEKLSEIAEQLVNPDAATSEEGDEEENDEREMAGAAASSGSKAAKRGANGGRTAANRQSARGRTGSGRGR